MELDVIQSSGISSLVDYISSEENNEIITAGVQLINRAFTRENARIVRAVYDEYIRTEPALPFQLPGGLNGLSEKRRARRALRMAGRQNSSLRQRVGAGAFHAQKSKISKLTWLLFPQKK